MRYELQVHALSPLRPTAEDLLLRAGESGLPVETVTRQPTTDEPWTTLVLRSPEAADAPFTVAVSARHSDLLEELRAAASEGQDVPDQALESAVIYELTCDVDDEAPDEAGTGAFVVTAWALAGLTEGLVFDPQEDFFADADSFWALISDEDAADAALDPESEGGCWSSSADGPDADENETDSGPLSGPLSTARAGGTSGIAGVPVVDEREGRLT